MPYRLKCKEVVKMNDWIRDALAEEQGYTICPLAASTYTVCDNDCNNCDIHKEFEEELRQEALCYQ